MVFRNPLLAAERARKRQELLRATERLLAPIMTATARATRPLRGTEQVAMRVGKMIGKYKVAKHFYLDITDTSFSYRRNAEAIDVKPALDRLYIARTSLTADDRKPRRRCRRTGSSAWSSGVPQLQDRRSEGPPDSTTTALSARTCFCSCWPTTSNGTWGRGWHRCYSMTTIRPAGEREPVVARATVAGGEAQSAHQADRRRPARPQPAHAD